MKGKGKAIIGIVMAAIMLASVLAVTTVVLGWNPTLTAELSTSEIDPGDTFTVSGNATELEIEQVDIITLAPCGGGGKGMNGSAGTYIPITLGYVSVPATIPGITYVTASVSEDDTFSKEIHVHSNAEPGNYSVIVLHPGRDGYYGWGIPNGSMLLPAIVRDYCSGKAPGFLCRTQAQLFAIIEDATTWTAGSDDLMVALQIKVKGTPTPCPTPCVSLDPISAIEVGDPLRVTGSTCRGDTPILITVWGPSGQESQVVQPQDGKFEATFDTEGIVPGTYGVRAEDIEEGYCDITYVEIQTPTPPEEPKSEIHVHKKEYLSTYDTHIDHNKIYDFTPEWSANVWDVENLDNVTYTITTSKNFTYINNWERYQDGTENTFILPPTVEGENYTWVLPLKDRIGSNINFVLDSSQTIQDNPWVDIDVNTTKEDGYERVNVTFMPVVPLDWINLYVRGNQIIEVSAYPPEFEIEMLTSSYVEFDSGGINQGYVYNFSVLVDNPYEVELELYASFGWDVESPSNLITLPVAELGSVTVEVDVPVIWEHTPTLPESVQSIAIEFEEEKGFDTEEGTYPSIMGTHKGEIKPSHDITVSTLYTYPCAGTGGHTESIELYENTTLIASGTWNGYQDDYHNITISPSVTLLAGHTYKYTIVTGSYPQIIHEHEYKNATGGTITCTSFVDANGKTYTDWIPAIRLE